MAGRQWFALAGIGRDRPGIVADLSECVYECGCNLEDASMTTLGNEFATLMLVSGTGESVGEDLIAAVRRLEWERRLTVFVRPIDDLPDAAAIDPTAPWKITVEGVDKAGIVARVTRCLADREILISDLRSKIIPTPEAGTPLYQLSLRIHAPGDEDEAGLRDALDGIAEKLDVDIALESKPA